MKTNKSGISLIVLVITIIVMIILAAAIILSLNSAGITGKANQAKNDVNEATLIEAASIHLADYELLTKTGELDRTTISAEDYVKEKLVNVDKYTEEQVKNLNILRDGTIQILPTIPADFVVSQVEGEQKVAEGLVIYEIPVSERGTVNWASYDYGDTTMLDVHEKYNQYVWIPVKGDFATEDGYGGNKKQTWVLDGKVTEPYTNGYSTEASDYNKMKASVKENFGFYIARYEAGKETINDVDTVVSKKGAAVWNKVSWGASAIEIGDSGAAYLARNVFPESANKDVVSTLIYSVQWDAVIKLMANIPNVKGIYNDYYIMDSTLMGWYKENADGNPDHITGIDINVDTNSDGEFDLLARNKVMNIYDMAGNVREWTMEMSGTDKRVHRGGSFYSYGYGTPASYRYDDISTGSGSSFGFRVALYLN